MNRQTIRWSEEATRRTVLAGTSLNLETTALVTEEFLQRVIEESADLITPGLPDQKIAVEGIVIYDDPMGDGKIALITYHGGHTQTFHLGRTVSERIAAGSSANIANALAVMGCQDTGILGAIGGGNDGTALTHSLIACGFNDLLLLRRETEHKKGGTAQSLFLKTAQGTTICFSLKPPYTLDANGCEYLRNNTTARVIVCSGFMPYEFSIIDALLNTRAKPKARVVSPHRACFKNGKDRKKCLEFAARATLFQINSLELRELLGLQQGWEDADDQEVADILRAIPAELVCVTMNVKGSVTYVKSQNRLIRKDSGNAKEQNSPIGAGDVHLAYLIWCLWLRERRIRQLEAALTAAAWTAARKVEFQSETLRPWDGIPNSATRKSIVHAAENEYKNAPEWPENNHE